MPRQRHVSKRDPPPGRVTDGHADRRGSMVRAAVRRFAEDGYDGVRVEDVAGDLGLAKGTVFKYFGTKERLFLAAYRSAVAALPRYLDAPASTRQHGFFAVLRYWLRRTEHLVREDWIPYRVTLVGGYGTPLPLRREINRLLSEEDPYGTAAFVRFGVDRREVRDDIDQAMIVAMIDWLTERFQDALVTEELDPGLFPHRGDRTAATRERIDQFLDLLRGAIGTGAR
jgi:TetR/AcrR family transcriptional regulator